MNVAVSPHRVSQLAGLFALVAALVCTDTASGYEQATHGAVTREAYLRSRLNPDISDVVLRLGFDTSQQTALGDWYVDFTTVGSVMRKASPDDNPTFGTD